MVCACAFLFGVQCVRCDGETLAPANPRKIIDAVHNHADCDVDVRWHACENDLLVLLVMPDEGAP